MAYLNKLVEDRVSLTIPIDPNDPDNKVHLVYRPNGYTGQVEGAIDEVNPGTAPSRYMREMVCAFVESWDLKWDEADPEPIPLDVDDLIDVPAIVLGGIVERVSKDITARNPKRRTSKRSNAR